jgi:hypothetical protein
MGLLEAIEAENRNRPIKCPVALAIRSMSDEDANDLNQALSNSSIRHQAISNVLSARGYSIHAQGVSRHRNRLCACAAQ